MLAIWGCGGPYHGGPHIAPTPVVAYWVQFYDVLSCVPPSGCVLIWCLFMTGSVNIMMGQPIATQCLFKSISFHFKVIKFCYRYCSIWRLLACHGTRMWNVEQGNSSNGTEINITTGQKTSKSSFCHIHV